MISLLITYTGPSSKSRLPRPTASPQVPKRSSNTRSASQQKCAVGRRTAAPPTAASSRPPWRSVTGDDDIDLDDSAGQLLLNASTHSQPDRLASSINHGQASVCKTPSRRAPLTAAQSTTKAKDDNDDVLVVDGRQYLHARHVREARRTGSLQLSNRRLQHVPDQVWQLNERIDSPPGDDRDQTIDLSRSGGFRL